MRLPYTEGTLFVVPLRKGGFATGLVARTTNKGRVVLAYLYGPKLTERPSIEKLEPLTPRQALRVLRIGDLSLINGDWPILGQLNHWDRNEWPIPNYVRRDDLSKKAWKVFYSDINPNQLLREEPWSYDDYSLQSDSVYGSGAVELVMTKLLE
jgi:hypothetical protein